jgi:predicted nucleic acid-binding protein
MKTFVDTSPFIYLIEKHSGYHKKLKDFFTNLYVNEDRIISSVITFSEFGVKPYQNNQLHLIEDFEFFINQMSIALLDVNKLHAKKAYQLRAKYPFLKGMDSIQLGTAIVEKCKLFLTNDKQLKKIDEISVVLVEEIE